MFFYILSVTISIGRGLAEFIRSRTPRLFIRERERKRVSRGDCGCRRVFWRKGGLRGGWQIRWTHSDQSPKENEGRYRKAFRDASARNIKVRAISSVRIQMKYCTYRRGAAIVSFSRRYQAICARYAHRDK